MGTARSHNYATLWVVLTVSGALIGCGGLQPVKSVPSSPAVLPKKVDPMTSARETMEARLLAQAEDAFRRGQLTRPAHANAYDRFHSVLMLNPNNDEARAGLQAMVIQLADGIRQELSVSRYTQAKALLAEAELYFPGHPLLMDLKQAIRTVIASERKTRRQETVSRQAAPSIDEYPLSTALLSDARESLLPLLSTIAQRVSHTDESVMIYARTDAEGRWIYQQMKKAVEGYRIRGDIRLAKQPKVAILPPL